ncbi:hypothetical protein NOV72_01825 [Caballeronia novacaledonica]|uniref:Molybdopterin-guanine dinucleotide biosynthesis protein MobB n=1 Tax=Caballeronia novacaledonica TaxID=1544861 RepID=A0A2U3I383_9BURK|nr:DUF2889 domain-containing protein [Caballeronia novacaledonica]SPB14582.1 hypothetical protein NOV72_01825 [Caballeronia novacaledonica]
MSGTNTIAADCTLIHTRQITCDVYQRSDGAYEVESSMFDRKTAQTTLPFRTVAPNEKFHDMRLALTVSSDLVIERIEARTEAGPTPFCKEINAAYAELRGVRIGPGFKARVKEVVGGVGGCTHLTDLLGPIATTLIQASLARMQTAQRLHEIARLEVMPRPWVIDTCHAYRADGEAARLVWPIAKRAVTEESGRQPGGDTNASA